MPLIALAAACALLALFATGAEAKSGKLDGQLLANATQKGSKVEAPVLLSSKSMKKLKLKAPIATLTTRATQQVSAPNPQGGAPITVAAGALRAGDTLKGKAKTKGSTKKPLPILKAQKFSISKRESAYSVDELTAAVVGLYQQVAALGLRVDSLEGSVSNIIVELQKLKDENAGLAGQINGLLAQLNGLQTALDDLDDLVSQFGLDLDAAEAAIANLTSVVIPDITSSITDLQTELDNLGIGDISGLQGELDGLTSDLSGLQGQIDTLGDDLLILCGLPAVPLLPGSFCP